MKPGIGTGLRILQKNRDIQLKNLVFPRMNKLNKRNDDGK